MWLGCLHQDPWGVEMWTVEPLLLTLEERGELERRLRAQTTAHRDRQRARVLLLAADAVTGRQIAKTVGLSEQSVQVAGSVL